MSSRVFLVDDDQSARRGIARLLRAAGHEPWVCTVDPERIILAVVQKGQTP